MGAYGNEGNFGDMRGGYGSSGGYNGHGGSQGGGFWGSILSTAINAGVSYYAGQQQQDAMDDANKRQQKAMDEAQARQNKYMKDAQDKQNKLMADRDLAASEANIPIGESATIDFGGQDETMGSSIDFLVPKVGKSQLSVGSRSSGLGV